MGWECAVELFWKSLRAQRSASVIVQQKPILIHRFLNNIVKLQFWTNVWPTSRRFTLKQNRSKIGKFSESYEHKKIFLSRWWERRESIKEQSYLLMIMILQWIYFFTIDCEWVTLHRTRLQACWWIGTARYATCVSAGNASCRPTSNIFILKCICSTNRMGDQAIKSSLY